jgi:hypothetical protein
MPGLVTGTEYGILILGAIGCVIFGIVATIVQMIRKKK